MARENKTFSAQMAEAEKLLKKTSDIQKAWAVPLIMRVHPPEDPTPRSSTSEKPGTGERLNKMKR